MHTDTTPREKPTGSANYPAGHTETVIVTDAVQRLRLAGHAVHRGACGDFTVSKWGYSYYAQDLFDLRDFAIRLGVPT